MCDIGKSFGSVTALQGVDLDLRPGEVLGIIGENGAGKSTLIKMLAGAHLPDQGRILLGNQEVTLANPHRARQLGIGVIHQEFSLVPFLTARENIFLGQARQRWGWIRVAEEQREASRWLQQLGAGDLPEVPVERLSVAQQQLVEIAKALASDVRILVMDEPTATLSPAEVERLLDVVRELRSRGIGVIYISHRLEEITAITDRMLVLRDGRLVGQGETASTSRRWMIETMVGRNIEDEFPRHAGQRGTVLLEASRLRWRNRVRDVSLQARAGEVLGLTGLVGAGRTELVRLLAGAEIPQSGSLLLRGKPFRPGSPRDAIAAGICLLTEDRQGQGLVLDHSLVENFGLPNLGRFSRLGWIRQEQELTALAGYVEQLKIRIADPRQPARQLSGGNQQKLVLAKWLQRECQVIIVDEPTRGIDVGAKYEIYLLINRLAAAGKTVIVASSEIPEVLGICDRVLVMCQGRIAGEIDRPQDAHQSDVMELAAP